MQELGPPKPLRTRRNILLDASGPPFTCSFLRENGKILPVGVDLLFVDPVHAFQGAEVEKKLSLMGLHSAENQARGGEGRKGRGRSSSSTMLCRRRQGLVIATASGRPSECHVVAITDTRITNRWRGCQRKAHSALKLNARCFQARLALQSQQSLVLWWCHQKKSPKPGSLKNRTVTELCPAFLRCCC